MRRNWKSIVQGLGSTDLEVHRTGIEATDLEVHRTGIEATDLEVHRTGIEATDLEVHRTGIEATDLEVHRTGIEATDLEVHRTFLGSDSGTDREGSLGVGSFAKWIESDRMTSMKSLLYPCRGELAASVMVVSLLVGCQRENSSAPQASVGAATNMSATGLTDVDFLDQVASNREDDGTVNGLEFVDTNGQRVRLSEFNGKKNLVLVFTRGFSGQLCPYCTTQTSRLIANYDKFKERGAEVLLVYPGSKEQLPQFRQAGLAASGEASFPFPVLLDEDLAAVNQLGIAAQLASPSTFIIDKQGKVWLSYVGSNPADRPSIQAMLDQLDQLRQAG